MRIEIMIDKEQKISQSTLDALESELYRNLRPLYPKTVIRIKKRCWRLNLLLASARLNNEPLRGVSSVVHVYAA